MFHNIPPIRQSSIGPVAVEENVESGKRIVTSIVIEMSPPLAESPTKYGTSAVLRQQRFCNNLGTFRRYRPPQNSPEGTMKKYIIERDIPSIGRLEGEQLREGADQSNQALRQLGPDIQWVQSFVAADKMFCVYLAENESLIQRHAELSGFVASRITEIGKTIDPTTADRH